MPFLFHAAGISRSQGDHFKTEGHFKNSQREFISSRLCRLLIAALSYQRLPPRGSWILRSKRLKEIALVKTLHKFHLYALSLSHLRCQLPPGRSLKTQRPHCVHFQLSIFNFQLDGGSKPTALRKRRFANLPFPFGEGGPRSGG